MKEIERKFLVTSDEFDGMEPFEESIEIIQDYLAVGDEEIRIRKTTHRRADHYTLTIKRGSGLEREEQNIPISKESFYQMMEQDRALYKTRTAFVLPSGYIAYRDAYKHMSTHIVEMEFDTVEEAEAYVPEFAYIEEVTDDPEFKNQNIWLKKNQWP